MEFRGVVRPEEDGVAIAGLEYEAYPAMAEREFQRLLAELASRHDCLAASVVHRLGVVPAGEAAILARVEARHRGPALALLGEFLDRIKQDVPIWKRRTIPVVPVVAASPAPSASTSADALLALLREACAPLPAEQASLAEASGRVLREAVRASEDQPPFDRSAVDGYAVRLDETAARLRVVDQIRAGDWKPRRLAAGEAVRIATGGALPGEGLRVVMREDARAEEGMVVVSGRDAGRNIRFRGEDAPAGAVLAEAGTILSPGALALLASIGAAHPLVTRLPRVLHLATGNEIVAPDQTPPPGGIRDSNSTLVRAFLEAWRVVPEQMRIPEDETAAMAGLERRGLADVDLLLVSGGASVGEHDFTRRLLERLGFQILVSRMATRPGKPLLVARRAGTFAFGLPGNPLAHFVCLNLFVRTALDRLAGRAPGPVFHSGVLASDLAAGGSPRETFWPARAEWRDGVALLAPLGWSSSGDLTALAAANALLRVPPGAEVLPQGSRVGFLSTATGP